MKKPLILTGTLCGLGALGEGGLASLTPDTPRILFQLADGSAVHLVGLSVDLVRSMVPQFYEPVRIVVEAASANPAEFDRIGTTPPVEAPVPFPAITNAQIDAIADAQPGGIGGFMKQWGYRQFAREILALQMPPTWEPQFDCMTPEQERLVMEFCQEIAGPKGQPGSPPDPVRLLDMAEALYKAERADAALLQPGSPA